MSLAPTRWLYNGLSGVGLRVTHGLTGLGDVALFSLSTCTWLLRARPRPGTLTRSFYQIGVLSLPVVALTGTFIGMVLAVHSFNQFRLLGFQSWVGGIINRALVRELGPVLAATMLAGRVGSAMAAELGTMRITEQIDALSSMGTNPIHYLVVPRFLGCLVLIPTLTVMADFMGVVGGYVFCTALLGVDSHHYWEHAQHFVSNTDLAIGLIKSLFFGAAIGLVSCHQGFHSEAGRRGCGQRRHAGVRVLVRDHFAIGPAAGHFA